MPTARINAITEGPGGFLWMASEGAGLLRYDGYEFETYGLERFPVLDEVVYDELNERLLFHDGQKLWSYDGLEFTLIWEAPKSIDQLFIIEGQTVIKTKDELWHCQGMELSRFDLKVPTDSEILVSAKAIFMESANRFSHQLDWTDGSLQVLAMDTLLDLKVAYPWLENTAYTKDEIRDVFESDAERAALVDDKLYLALAQFQKEIPLPIELSMAGLGQVYVTRSKVVLMIGRDAIYRLNSAYESHYPRRLPILSLAEYHDELYLSTALGLEKIAQASELNLEGVGLILTLAGGPESLFLGTERGLFSYRPDQQELRNLGLSGFIFSLYADQDQLWVGSSSGIWTYSYQDQSVKQVLGADAIDGASIFRIRSNAQNELWMASYTKGLWRAVGDSLEKVDRIGDFSLDSLSFSAFELLDDGRIALATLGQGLYLIDPESTKLVHYDIKSLAFAEIRELINLNGQLWLGTNKGLLSLRDVEECSKAQESAQLHFFGGPISSRAMLQIGDSLVAAGEQGLFFWNTSALEQQAKTTSLGVLKISLLQQEKDSIEEYGSELEPYTELVKGLDLNYDQNYLRFNYGLRSIFYPDWVQYRYRLLGQSDAWTYAGNRREVLFTDLKPGDYYLEVEARYPWQGWQLKTEAYHFKIDTAVWLTWWFWALILLVLSSITYLWLRDRYRRAAERLILENELMEMERKALRLQMNPHFIFNALDSISSFIFKKDPKQAVRYLNNFAKLMRLTLESSMEHLHPVETEVSILKNYLELEKLRFSDKFDYSIELDEEIDYDVGLPPMLIQPHVENAILHGIKPKEGSGFLQISFKLEGEKLCCTIDDDGIGREAAKLLPGKKAHRSMATQINKDRIDLLRRSVDDVIELRIIDKHNQAGEATGTTVIIRLPAQEL